MIGVVNFGFVSLFFERAGGGGGGVQGCREGPSGFVVLGAMLKFCD